MNVEGDEKVLALEQLLNQIPGLTVVFTETKRAGTPARADPPLAVAFALLCCFL
eukprot:COSAG05_NODE_8599_length_689_cov_1.296610_1_plen_53_part_10